MKKRSLFLYTLILALQVNVSLAFQQQRLSTLPTTNTRNQRISLRPLASSPENNTPKPYVPIREDLPLGKQKKALVPKVGDVVRYYDLDGGEEKGQVKVGKVSYVFGSRAYGGFSVELYELEDVGDGHFAEYASALRSRKGRKTERRLEEVSPIAASFVGSEQAYKVPIDAVTKLPKPRQETYDIDEYEGPSFYATIDESVLEKDAENYTALKLKLSGLTQAANGSASAGSPTGINNNHSRHTRNACLFEFASQWLGS